ncbi:hypothetical protein MJN76_31125, partial [Salmonella enterica subsp. enterica serovar Anatum]|nr:hypothetical protein [Salmonella enterica subsp. enterica serovar Anatum]
KEEACAGEAITLVLNDDIDISRGDLLLAANETLAPARHAAIDADFVGFLILGGLSIIAAITYTVGNRPYGYIGLGDISVLVFFG